MEIVGTGLPEPARHSSRRLSAFVWFLLLAAADIALGLMWASGASADAGFLAGHATVIACLGLVWRQMAPPVPAIIPIGFIAVSFAGPVGASGALLLTLLMHISKPNSEQLDDWYNRLSDSTRRDLETTKYRDIVSGRARGSRIPSVHNFNQVMSSGDTREKQTLLGIIALKYHPDFFLLLKMALRDKEPTIRVQAAAVYAKLRMRFKERYKAALAPQEHDGGEEHTVADRIDELQYCIKSGFLETGETSLARKAIASLIDSLSPEQQQDWPMLLARCEVFLLEQSYDAVIERLRPLHADGDAKVGELYRRALYLKGAQRRAATFR